MNDASPRFRPFPAEYRAAGVLLHVASLPSPYGIGDLGPAARAWLDRLQEAGQSWWQALPLGPTGYGNSPYQSLSSFAANELLISPDGLIEDGLLAPGDCEANSFPAASIDYPAVIAFKHRLLEIAWNKFSGGARADLRPSFDKFRHEQMHWLEDYALFRALKARYNGAYYLEWPVELVHRAPAALTAARQEMTNQISQICFAQFLLFRQGRRLREHALAKGIRLIGDLPFFVSPDFKRRLGQPGAVPIGRPASAALFGGVPPDYFSADGQLWGNPVYDWGAIRRTGYRFWIQRLRAFDLDIIRLDHFRAFAAAWHVPAGAATARTGQWAPGPGADFFSVIEKELGILPFVAEDLGLITPDVSALREQFRLPGMRVLQFAFDGDAGNPHLPNNYAHNTVVYTGTHDNPTTRGWFEELPNHERQNLWNYLQRPGGDSTEAASALIGSAWSSAAALAMVPLQDLLGLGNDARMNQPGRADGNWGWRCTEDMLTGERFRWLQDLTNASGRSQPGPHG